MDRPKFIEKVVCPICSGDGVAMTLPSQSSVCWCSKGHVSVRQHLEKAILVHDFTKMPCEGEEG